MGGGWHGCGGGKKCAGGDEAGMYGEGLTGQQLEAFHHEEGWGGPFLEAWSQVWGLMVHPYGFLSAGT